jgi:hypothetical protein
LTHGFTLSPRLTALRASSPAAIVAFGLVRAAGNRGDHDISIAKRPVAIGRLQRSGILRQHFAAERPEGALERIAYCGERYALVRPRRTRDRRFDG